MSPPDATIALLSDSTEITSVFSVPPFQYQQLEKPGIRTVLNSTTCSADRTPLPWRGPRPQFRDKNPALYKALVAAFQEATEMLNKDVKPAAQYWIDNVKSKTDRREGRRDRLRQAGEMDDGAGEHDEIRRVHACGRLDQDQAGELEGLVLPRGARHCPAADDVQRTRREDSDTGRADPAMNAPSSPTPLLQVQGRDAAIQDRAASRHRHLSRQLRRSRCRPVCPARALRLREVDAAQGRRRLHGADRRRHATQGTADPRAGRRPRVRVPGVRSAAALEDGQAERDVRAGSLGQDARQGRRGAGDALHREGQPDQVRRLLSRTRSRAA